MSWHQQTVTLRARSRGFHLVTHEVTRAVPEIAQFAVGIAHLFIQHTSASLTLNENASPEVRADFERFVRDAVPDDTPYFAHTLEGPDDMPAHVKASLFGSSVSVPIRDGRLALGTWQGLYLGEHRDHGDARRLVVTLHGERVPGGS